MPPGAVSSKTASQLVAAQERPEFALGGGERFAELAGFLVTWRGGSSWGHGRILPPPVLPQILWIWGRCPKDGGGLNLQNSRSTTPETTPPCLDHLDTTPDVPLTGMLRNPPRLDGRVPRKDNVPKVDWQNLWDGSASERFSQQAFKKMFRLTLRLGLTGAQTLHPRRNPRKFFLQGERGEGDFQFAKFC